MSVMLSLLSWSLLVMAAGGGLNTNSATAEVTIASNSAAVAAYWHTMLPNTIMPSAILELLAPPACIIDHVGKRNTNNVQTTGKMKEAKYVGASLLKARKMGVHSTNEANTHREKIQMGVLWWIPSTTNNIQKSLFFWVLSTINDVQNMFFLLSPATKNDVQKSNSLDVHCWQLTWGRSTTNDVQNGNFRNWGWGSSTKNDIQKTHGRWVSTTTNDVQKINGLSGPSTTNDVPDGSFRNWGWGSSTKNDIQKNKGSWGSSTTNDAQKSNAGESHIGQDNHKHGTMPNRVFIEESLKPGSTIPCYVLPSYTSGAPLLRRDVADTIPMSTRNFTDIMAMFAPLSNNMAADIWSALDYCEHPQATKGETKACATSVESMVEFAASVLGVSTYNLRAFSSPDVPAEGVMTGRRYKVAAATRVTQARDTITCHGVRFPFAMFMCHAVNPTRVYSVTLEGDDVGADGPGQRMEVLAVCHLDTSDFDPAKMPVHVKPGDAPLCHFVSRDSILWAPAAPASGQAAA